MEREVRKMHQCDAECDMRHIRRSHERSRLARRASVLAKLHGKHPKVRAALVDQTQERIARARAAAYREAANDVRLVLNGGGKGKAPVWFLLDKAGRIERGEE